MTRREWLFTAGAASAAASEIVPVDPRNLDNGHKIVNDGYADQPYAVVLDDGNWLCVVTTGAGREGYSGQHVVSTISRDQGVTWSKPLDIEPATGPEASWAIPLKTPGGRVYVFYTYNKDNVRELNSNRMGKGFSLRVDTMGVFAFRYSDDNGRSWSRERYEIPMREMRLDRENGQKPGIKIFWSVSKPIIYRHGGRTAAMFGFSKIGRWGYPGGLVESQGCFLRSENILTERDPARIRWELLPDGDEGLRAPKGPVSEEVNLTPLSDGSLYATYRTIDGYNCHAYSHDDGHHWTPTAYATYTPGGRRIKHPRAANFVWRLSNGRFLLWYHNQGGEQFHAGKLNYYLGRNPGWLTAGREKNGLMYWSQPEIALYDDVAEHGISYPDFIEDHGRYFLTETQKSVARVHEIDRTLLEGMWNQEENRSLARNGLVLEARAADLQKGASVAMPRLPALNERRGFAIELQVWFRELSPEQVLLDARDASGKGLLLGMSDRSTLNCTLSDGHTTASWDSDPGTHEGTLRVGMWQHITLIVDGGPRVITWVVDGILNDGGAVRQYGWTRFPAELADVNGASEAQVAPSLYGKIRSLRVWDRYLRTSEAVGNFQSSL